MLKDYLSVAQDALRTQKELYHVKEQRLALALDEYVRLNDAYKEKSSSRTSLFSGSSSSTKYDPDILKAEISTTRLRVTLEMGQGGEAFQCGGRSSEEKDFQKEQVDSCPLLACVKKLKRELSQMKQELLYKEQGFETLQQIDKKMSGGQSGYELSEAKAILTELKSIRKAISSGEKEKQDLMQSLAKLQERFHLDQSMGRSEPDLRSSSVNSHLSLSRQTLDAGSQTSISGDIGMRSRSNLAEKVRLSLQYEEAKRSMANLKIELSKLDSEAWPGALDVEKEKLLLMNEKEELLKELQFVTPQKRTQDELEHLEAERQRLEEELLSVRGAPSRALAERLKLEERRKELLQKLEETTKLTTYLHSQLKSLSASTLSMSSGSSLGSLASSRGSLNTSSRGSLNSLSSSELYYSSQGDQIDADYQYKLDFLLQEKGGYIPSGPITTIHENEVVKSPSQPGQSGPCGAAAAATGHTPPLTEAPKSVTSLSSRSSLSSLSPPGSPLVLEGTFPTASHDVPLHQFTADFEDCELSSHFADIGLGDSQILLDTDSGGASESLLEDKDLSECARGPLYEGTTDSPALLVPVYSPTLPSSGCIASCSPGKSVADPDPCWMTETKLESLRSPSTGSSTEDVAFGLWREAESKRDVEKSLPKRRVIHLLGEKTACVSAAVSDESVAGDSGVYEAFVKQPSEVEDVTYSEEDVAIVETAQVQIGLSSRPNSLIVREKKLDLRREEQDGDCSAGTQISLADLPFSNEIFTLWYNLLPSKQMPCKKNEEENEDSVFQPNQPLVDSIDLDAVSALLARTSAELLAVEQELAQEEEEAEPGPEEEQRGPEGDW
ncbi:hypothetical protein HPG69_009492 [Diceros bicornis minor]|uniref:WWC1-like helical hairpin domain-containing protein n=1 Tax=Diceros bicornis minor TaxID=77932 RepID=A0A7J7F3K4_DICBM|nr:hypothetical protein HPG69_009492 [Diceros bicornis minor]